MAGESMENGSGPRLLAGAAPLSTDSEGQLPGKLVFGIGGTG